MRTYAFTKRVTRTPSSSIATPNSHAVTVADTASCGPTAAGVTMPNVQKRSPTKKSTASIWNKVTYRARRSESSILGTTNDAVTKTAIKRAALTCMADVKNVCNSAGGKAGTAVYRTMISPRVMANRKTMNPNDSVSTRFFKVSRRRTHPGILDRFPGLPQSAHYRCRSRSWRERSRLGCTRVGTPSAMYLLPAWEKPYSPRD